MTFRQAIALLSDATRKFNSVDEARSVARRIVIDMAGLSLTQLMCQIDTECTIPDVEDIASRLSDGCPAQYIIGFTDFAGFRIRVSPSVLIPRPETEYMVSAIVAECSGVRRALDVCTGSGAIAIAIAGLMPGCGVVGIDLSDAALSQAEANASLNGVDVAFRKRDALQPLGDLGKFDLVVSNPPYVPGSERGSMQRCVTEYEPHMALFVDDSDPLAFYRSISCSAFGMLNDGGTLCFEIHERFGEETGLLVRQCGFRNVEVRKDQFGKDRTVWAVK